MQKLKILFATSEIDPFLKITSAADIIRMLPQGLQERGHEIRILMPKFGIINERRNRLHEVVRLSGINIRVGNEEKPLTIKVASIPNAKLQVYFLDNEDYFNRKSALTDPKNNQLYSDNDERSIFFCKGAIETVKKLGWGPDIIHCHDWMTSLIPYYLKTLYKDDPMFQNTKVVYSIYNNHDHNTQLSDNFLEKAKLDTAPSELIASLKSNNLDGVMRGGISLCDAVAHGDQKISSDLNSFIRNQDKLCLEYSDSSDKDSYVDKYQELYQNILN
jgi:starch synthase